MANDDSPIGLRPLRHKSGAPYNGAARPYFIPATYNVALFIGDPVVKTGTANTAVVKVPGGGTFGIATLPEINKSATGGPATGVIVGFAANPDNLTLKHNPASTERVAFVCDDPDIVFEVQGDSAGALAATDVGNNADFIFTHAGSTVTGLSGVELSQASINTTIGLALKILRAVNREDNEATSVNGKFEVMINDHTDAHGVGVTGI